MGNGDLTIASLQDTSHYQSKQKNAGFSASLCIPPFCYGASSGSVSLEQAKANSDYASVVEQSGLFAGDGGFQINVKGNTDLVGAVIGASQQAVIDKKNILVTETLTSSNLQNHMDAKATREGLSANTGMLSGKNALAKGVLGNALNADKKQVDDSSVAKSAISQATVTVGDITYQPGEALRDSQGNAVITDTDNTNRTLNKPDLAAMQAEIQQRQAEKTLLMSTIAMFTDEAFRSMFLLKAKMYYVERDEKGKVAIDENTGKPRMHELSNIEKLTLKPANGKRLNVFTNGINNTLEAAREYSVQMSEAPLDEKVYFVYFPEANNLLSELMIAAYQKQMESNKMGLANATKEIKELARIYGKDGLNLIGHSRGGMTIGNAEKSLLEDGEYGVLNDTNIKLVGSAFSVQEAADMLKKLSEGNKDSAQMQTHIDDFVGRIIGGNDATYGIRPPGSNFIREWVHIFGDAPTAHSCYGVGGHKKCVQQYGNPEEKTIYAN